MTLAINPGLGMLYNSAWAGQTPLSATNTIVQSAPFNLQYTDGCSVQIKSDGGAVLAYNFQVTDFPMSLLEDGIMANGASTRDDSTGSVDWQTPDSGSGVLASGTPTCQILILDINRFLFGRLQLSYTSGGTANTFAVIRTLGH